MVLSGLGLIYFFWFSDGDIILAERSQPCYLTTWVFHKAIYLIVHFCNLFQRLFSSDANVAMNQSEMQQEPKQRVCANVNETSSPGLCQKQLLWVQAPSLEDWVMQKASS